MFNMDSIPLGKIQSIAYQRSNASIVDLSRQTKMLPPHFNPTKDKAWSFELGVMFPSLLPHPAEGFYFTHMFWPVSHDTCLWEGTYYLAPPQTNSERWAQEYSQVLQRNAWLEDTETMENTHTAMMSGGRKHMHLQDEEILIRHGYKVVQDWIDGNIKLG